MNLELARTSLSSKAIEEVLAALAALAEHGQLTDLQGMLPLVKHSVPDVQKAAIRAISTLIRQNLITHFSKLEPSVREKLSGLMESLHPQIIEEISKDIRGDDDERRLRAVQILGLLKKNPKVRDVLADLVQDRDVKIRATAINLLGKMVGPHEHQVILSLLKDPDKRVRANTVEALESLGNQRMVPILLRFRKDPNNRIRGNVIKALYNLGHTEVEEDLKTMLQSNDDFMKASALWVVTKIRLVTKDIEDIAGHCLISDNAMVLDNANKALGALDTPRSRGYLQYLVKPPG